MPEDTTRECVKVVVRCRPPNKKEIAEKRKSIVKMNTETGYVTLENPRQEGSTKGFTFDAVYDKDSTQRMVYDETAFPLVESVLEGFNGTIFAYGQTGCGKTWTMSGMEDPDPGSLLIEERGKLRGIIPNSFEHIFNTIKLRHASEEEGTEKTCEFLVRATYLEIYNEEIRDLMSPDPKKKLELKESPEKGVYVRDLMYEVVDNRDQIDAVLARGNNNRTVGATLMNSISSRSHSIFSIVIEVNETDAAGNNHIRAGKLNLVDLAGSERQSKTGASGDRLREGCKINLSLSALGNVISALVDGKGRHIPYRDSKLTRLLQDSLGGNTKTVMISAISPADYNYEETLSTLRYANRAKNIKNKPVINEDPKDTLLRQYKDEILKLKRMLEMQMNATNPAHYSAPAIEYAVTHAVEQPGGSSRGGSSSSGSSSTNSNSGSNKNSNRKNNDADAQVETKVVEVEKVVEKVVPDKLVEAENRALQDYSDAVVEQRNRLGEELDRKEVEMERQQREREGLEKKLRRLESHVLGQDKNVKEDELRKEKVIEARKQRELRKAQLKLKEQQRKEAELRQAKERAEEEKRLIEEEFKNAQGTAEAKQKALRALKRSMASKMEKVRLEMQELEEEFQDERESLLETIREQTRDIKRLEQVIELFLPATERSKLWELSLWDDETAEWKLPKLRPRKGFKPLRLPDVKNKHSALDDDEHELEGGIEVEGPPARSPDKRRKSKSSTKQSRGKRLSLDGLSAVDPQGRGTVEMPPIHGPEELSPTELAERKAERRRERRRLRRLLREERQQAGGEYGEAKSVDRDDDEEDDNEDDDDDGEDEEEEDSSSSLVLHDLSPRNSTSTTHDASETPQGQPRLHSRRRGRRKSSTSTASEGGSAKDEPDERRDIDHEKRRRPKSRASKRASSSSAAPTTKNLVGSMGHNKVDSGVLDNDTLQSLDWTTEDLPVDGDFGSAGYGDRCQSRQGRRPKTPGKNTVQPASGGLHACDAPRQLAPL
ncbi:Kinesin-like protein FLA10 [Hondaea fermentalgiana]|uniref:Kinesin-like protein n=1 Tax=Hondaea fermentalgiana TaxID=2315210 RepID=A0A2R5GN55_9STRA|nr:Kinesin-like protein FLA10 [Hondaea fermentalgiana]|eukprot:GBG29741.1 Kinesin-like protein FLA10 [Hondaea fermentalgiana]